MECVRSYLIDRNQSVRIGTELSDPRIVAHDVPQGSILGPSGGARLALLFIYNPDETKLLLLGTLQMLACMPEDSIDSAVTFLEGFGCCS